jgi:hypothetical protein
MGTARRIGAWAGLKAARRLSKTVPLVGTALALAFVGHAVRRKGLLRGLLDSALDATPILGAVKAGVELVRGDTFPDRPAVPPAARS